MLSLLFTIIKIIGITILVLLGVFLLLLITVLFVPIRYKIEASHGETIQANGRVSWLLHILHSEITYYDNKLRIKLRVFGIKVYDSNRVRKPDKKEKIRKTHRKSRKSVKHTKQTKIEKSATELHRPDKVALEKIDSIEPDVISKETIEKENIKEENLIPENIKTENFTTDNIKTENTIEDDNISGYDEPSIKKFILIRIFDKIRSFIKNIITKVKSFFIKVVNIIKKIVSTLRNIKRIKNLILNFIREEENKEAIKLTILSTKKVLKHILPTNLYSEIIFGTGDPCSTGQALGAFSILYSFYGDNIKVTPDWENERFEGRHKARGRIRLFTLLIIGIKLILDKRFKRLTRNVKTLKEAL